MYIDYMPISYQMQSVLIIDNTECGSKQMKMILQKAGYATILATNINTAKGIIINLPSGSLIFSAQNFSDGTAVDLMNWIKQEGYNFPIVVIVDTLDPLLLINILCDHKAINVIQRATINKTHIDMVKRYADPCEYFGISPNTLYPRESSQYKQVLSKIEKIAGKDLNVLLIGDSGVGKEPIAKAIFQKSKRNKGPCVFFDAAVAAVKKTGKLNLYDNINHVLKEVDHGTLIIDNTHLLTIEIQYIISDILRLCKYDIRFICLSETGLISSSQSYNAHSSLFYKLSQYKIKVPSLKECKDDIIPLAEFFIMKFREEFNPIVMELDESAKSKLLSHDWQGNIRELRKVIRTATIETTSRVISSKDLDFDNLSNGPPRRFILRDDGDEKLRIISALEYTRGHRQQAADLLGIGRNTLQNKIKKYAISTNFD